MRTTSFAARSFRDALKCTHSSSCLLLVSTSCVAPNLPLGYVRCGKTKLTAACRTSTKAATWCLAKETLFDAKFFVVIFACMPNHILAARSSWDSSACGCPCYYSSFVLVPCLVPYLLLCNMHSEAQLPAARSISIRAACQYLAKCALFLVKLSVPVSHYVPIDALVAHSPHDALVYSHLCACPSFETATFVVQELPRGSMHGNRSRPTRACSLWAIAACKDLAKLVSSLARPSISFPPYILHNRFAAQPYCSACACEYSCSYLLLESALRIKQDMPFYSMRCSAKLALLFGLFIKAACEWLVYCTLLPVRLFVIIAHCIPIAGHAAYLWQEAYVFAHPYSDPLLESTTCGIADLPLGSMSYSEVRSIVICGAFIPAARECFTKHASLSTRIFIIILHCVPSSLFAAHMWDNALACGHLCSYVLPEIAPCILPQLLCGSMHGFRAVLTDAGRVHIDSAYECSAIHASVLASLSATFPPCMPRYSMATQMGCEVSVCGNFYFNSSFASAFSTQIIAACVVRDPCFGSIRCGKARITTICDVSTKAACKCLASCSFLFVRSLAAILPGMTNDTVAVCSFQNVITCGQICAYPMFESVFCSLQSGRVELCAVLSLLIITACTCLAARALLLGWFYITLPPCIPVRGLPAVSFHDAFSRGYMLPYLQSEATTGACVVPNTSFGSAPCGRARLTAVCNNFFMQAAGKCLATCAASAERLSVTIPSGMPKNGFALHSFQSCYCDFCFGGYGGIPGVVLGRSYNFLVGAYHLALACMRISTWACRAVSVKKLHSFQHVFVNCPSCHLLLACVVIVHISGIMPGSQAELTTFCCASTFKMAHRYVAFHSRFFMKLSATSLHCAPHNSCATCPSRDAFACGYSSFPLLFESVPCILPVQRCGDMRSCKTNFTAVCQMFIATVRQYFGIRAHAKLDPCFVLDPPCGSVHFSGITLASNCPVFIGVACQFLAGSALFLFIALPCMRTTSFTARSFSNTLKCTYSFSCLLLDSTPWVVPDLPLDNIRGGKLTAACQTSITAASWCLVKGASL